MVEPIQYGVALDIPEDVPEEGEGHLRIEIPELHPVVLRVTDAQTGQPIEGAVVHWPRHFTEDVADGWIEMDMAPDEESATIYLTEGHFLFAASGPDYFERSMDAYAGSDENQFTLELSPCISREIILQHRGTVVPWVEG